MSDFLNTMQNTNETERIKNFLSYKINHSNNPVQNHWISDMNPWNYNALDLSEIFAKIGKRKPYQENV